MSKTVNFHKQGVKEKAGYERFKKKTDFEMSKYLYELEETIVLQQTEISRLNFEVAKYENRINKLIEGIRNG